MFGENHDTATVSPQKMTISTEATLRHADLLTSSLQEQYKWIHHFRYCDKWSHWSCCNSNYLFFVSAACYFRNFGKTILQIYAERRLTVAVGIMIGVTIGLVASGGWGAVSAAIVIALPKVSVNVS